MESASAASLPAPSQAPQMPQIHQQVLILRMQVMACEHDVFKDHQAGYAV